MSHKELEDYKNKLNKVIEEIDFDKINNLSNSINQIWREKRNLFLCGNGGSAGNAIHVANDMIYGIGMGKIPGLNVEALSANSSVITCLANDTGYENIFSKQIEAKGKKDDMLICFSGSGNSMNIINAIEQAKKLEIKTFGVFGYTGGKAAKNVDDFIHVNINDMQISEDMQMIIMHMCVRNIMSNIKK
tara:strand:- start:2569 stop:3135 length:567 start_codon:yes stop_codon:yes gene_type:complete